MPTTPDEKKQNLTLQEVKTKLHNQSRNGIPLFVKVEDEFVMVKDKYIEVREFLKDHAHAPVHKLHKIIQEEKAELHKTIRAVNPLFAKVEDGYVEVKAFFKDMTQSLHFHIDLENMKPTINSLDTKAKRFHAPKQDEIKK